MVLLRVGSGLIFLGCRESGPDSVRAETREVRFTRQHGLGYLPLLVMEEQKLLEEEARAAGLGELKVRWATLGGGAAANDALLSQSADFAGVGTTPLITLWAKSRGEVKGVAALASAPVYLNTVDPSVRTLADFSDRDRIALPAAQVSIQAVVLQMAIAISLAPFCPVRRMYSSSYRPSPLMSSQRLATFVVGLPSHQYSMRPARVLSGRPFPPRPSRKSSGFHGRT
jgi:hypothetical protein